MTSTQFLKLVFGLVFSIPLKPLPVPEAELISATCFLPTVSAMFNYFAYSLVLGVFPSPPFPNSTLDSNHQSLGTSSVFLVLPLTPNIDVE